MTTSKSTTNDPHARRNDAQLAHYRRHSPDAWQKMIAGLSHEERVEAERRADAAELDSFIVEWDRRADGLARVAAALKGEGAIITATCPRCQQPISKDGTCGCNAPRPHVTATMIADVWQDGRRSEVAQILAALPADDRNRVETEYLQLLRARGHRVTLRVVRQQFELVIALPASPCEAERAGYVVERLAA